MVSHERVLILDNGSNYIRIGPSKSKDPSIVSESVVGLPKYRDYGDASEKEIEPAFGSEVHGANRQEKFSKIINPIQYGVIFHWELMEKYWKKIFDQFEIENFGKYRLLVTEIPMHPPKLRERLISIFLEKFGFRAVSILGSHQLLIYSSFKETGYLNGVIIEFGFNRTHVIPYYQGYMLAHAARKVDIGGARVSQTFRRFIWDRNKGKLKLMDNLSTPHLMDILMEAHCEVYPKEYLEDAMKESVSLRTSNISKKMSVKIGHERFKAPEILFKPSIAGLDYNAIDQIIVEAIESCDPEIRPDLYRNIVIGGGIASFPGLKERVTLEIEKRSPAPTEINVNLLGGGRFGIWKAGTRLVNQDPSLIPWLTRREYEDGGAELIHGKFFSLS